MTNEQNFDKLIVRRFNRRNIKREKFIEENFDKLLAIHSSKFSHALAIAIWYQVAISLVRTNSRTN